VQRRKIESSERSSRSTTRKLDAAFRASLEEIRRQAEDLRASRARIVVAGDVERRRIERNLHDGAQQQLVALAVKLNLAVLRSGPDEAFEPCWAR
jgi:signal transduction histidine kinase